MKASIDPVAYTEVIRARRVSPPYAAITSLMKVVTGNSAVSPAAWAVAAGSTAKHKIAARHERARVRRLCFDRRVIMVLFTYLLFFSCQPEARSSIRLPA